VDLVEDGESVVILRHGMPVAELVGAREPGLPMGIASHDPLVPLGDDWWQPISDEEAEDRVEGR
jgi:antitoxin (DNA-binding transcriptional repressor) of toxin-antitoxin stability system